MSSPGEGKGLKIRADRGGVAAKVIHGPVTVDNRMMVAPREVTWPMRVGQPPRLAVGYQHRPALDAKLQGLLGSPIAGADGTDGASDVVVLTQVLSGNGGVGKTQLAASAFDRADFDLRVWVTATSLDRLLTGFADAARGVQSTGWDDPDPASAAAGFLDWLATTSRSWLVVLDDMSVSDREMANWWPPSVPTGHILVTTRRRDASVSGRGRRIDVGTYTDQEAVEYLSRRLEEADDESLPADMLTGSAQLAAELGYLPVALAQAASVMINDAISASEYRDRYRDRSRHLAELMRDWDDTDGYERTVAATWTLAIDGADKLEPAGLARPAAFLASVLDPAGVPESIWTCVTGRTFLAFGAEMETDREPARDVGHQDQSHQDLSDQDPAPEPVSVEQARGALRALHRYSLLQHVPAHTSTAVRMHAVTQRALRDTLSGEDIDELVSVAAYALTEVWPETGTDAELVVALRASTAVVAELSPEAVWVPEGHPVLFQSGMSLGDSGLNDQARAYFAHLAQTATTRLGTAHPDTLAARANEALFQGYAGDASGAVAAYDELVPILTAVRGTTHPETLTARSNQTMFQGYAGDHAGAVAAYDELIPDLTAVVGATHPDTLTARNNRALFQGQAGDHAGAVAAYDELIPDLTAVRGATHPTTLAGRSNRALFQGQAGDHAGAVAAFDELIPDLTAVRGATHPDTLSARSNRALFQGYAGDYAGAVAAFDQLIPDLTAVRGATHPDTLAARSNRALFRGYAGDYAGAVAAFDELIPDLTAVRGATHPDTLAARSNRAAFQGQAGDHAGAVAAYDELIPDLTAVRGATHPDILQARSNRALFQGYAGDHAGAVTTYDQLIPDLTAVRGATHPDTLQARSNRAGFQGQAGDYAGEVTAYDELIPDLTAVRGATHPDTLTASANRAWAQGQAGDLATAVAELDRLCLLAPAYAGLRDQTFTTLLERLSTSRGETAGVGDWSVFSQILPNLVTTGDAYIAATRALRNAAMASKSNSWSALLLHSLLVLHDKFGADDPNAHRDAELYAKLSSEEDLA